MKMYIVKIKMYLQIVFVVKNTPKSKSYIYIFTVYACKVLIFLHHNINTFIYLNIC